MSDSPSTTAGASRGEAGVPVVDLTATVRGLLEHAEACREAQHQLMRSASLVHGTLSRQADYLEDLARVLGGGA